MNKMLSVFLVLVLMVGAGASLAGCQSNGDEPPRIERSEVFFWLDLIDSNVKSGAQLAEFYLAEDSPAQEKITKFLDLYVPISIVVRNNLDVLFRHYGDFTDDELTRYNEVMKGLAELEGDLAAKGVELPSND